MRAVLEEGPIAELWVVAREGEVAEAVQPLLLHLDPVGAERLMPGGRQVGILGKDVLDHVVSHGDRLLVLVLLQPAKPVAAAFVELVEVVDLELAAVLLIGGEAPVGGQTKQVGLEVVQTPILTP